ncbi:ATP-binding protein [Parenemella sanctibonifatiensis]|uniref:ATP-binding protein n=1 Tax=Parenemella sanctibonifatiensis TaxID=2016505 RepID=A0A255EIQ9_9ACTN|nr:ATP-binding protein [Parenemella sanctibonifatiensis]OYN91418.1 ATP-binding protein [Parenemella sanctibonifatiensis]
MEVKIGIRQVSREVSVETDLSSNDVKAAVEAAVRDDTLLELTDSKGGQVLVPGGAIGYVELGKENPRKVGFGAI